MGKVINTDDETVTFHYYHTSMTKSYTRAMFKPWTGADKHVTVGHGAVFHVFGKLTDTGIIPSKDRKFILHKAQTATREAEDSPIDDDDDNAMR